MLALSAFQRGGMAAALQIDDVRSDRPRHWHRSCARNGAEREDENEIKVHPAANTNAREPQGGSRSSTFDAREKRQPDVIAVVNVIAGYV